MVGRKYSRKLNAQKYATESPEGPTVNADGEKKLLQKAPSSTVQSRTTAAPTVNAKGYKKLSKALSPTAESLRAQQ